MLESLFPLANRVDFHSGALADPAQTLSRRVSDLADLFADRQRARALAEGEDPLVYEVHLPAPAPVPFEQELLYGTTVVHPGKVGDEYFMTKGHFHEDAGSPEIYLGCSGEGSILLMDRQGQAWSVPIAPGGIVAIPPGTAHRSVNTGGAPLVFFAVWPRRAGHDYASIARRGFSHRILERNGRPALVPVPDWS